MICDRSMSASLTWREVEIELQVGEHEFRGTNRYFRLELRQGGHELARGFRHLEQKGGGGQARTTRVLRTIALR